MLGACYQNCRRRMLSGRHRVGVVVSAALFSSACGDPLVLGENQPDSNSVEAMGGSGGDPRTGGAMGGATPDSCQFSELRGEEAFSIAVGTSWDEDPDLAGMTQLKSTATDNGTSDRVYVQVEDYHIREELLVALRESVLISERGDQDEARNPWDVFQVNGGSDVLQFAIDRSVPQVCPLDELESELEVRTKFFRQAWEPMTCNGSIYSVPLGLHRLNTVIVNHGLYDRLRELADEQGEVVPEFSALRGTEDLIRVLELARDLPLLNEEGVEAERVVPFSLCLTIPDPMDTEAGAPKVELWPLAIVAFENLLVADDDNYARIWEGSAEGANLGPPIRRMVDQLRRLREVSNLGEVFDSTCPGLGSRFKASVWQRAAEQVGAGKALLTIGGDWLRAVRLEEERDVFETYPYPGTSDKFVYTPDTFAVPRLLNRDGSAARFWLQEVVADKQSQLSFAVEKQAIPARNDIDLESGELQGPENEYLRESYAKFRACSNELENGEQEPSCELLLAVSGLAPPPGIDPCYDKLHSILAIAMGVPVDFGSMDDESWQTFREECGEPPTSTDGATDLLEQILTDISEHPYASECRSAD